MVRILYLLISSGRWFDSTLSPYSEFFYSSVIYYCFPCVTYVGPFPVLRPLVCSHLILPINFLRSIPSVSSPWHFPHCFWFSFSIPPHFFPSSCSSFSYSLVEVPSHEHTFFSVFFHSIFDISSCCLHLLAVVFS
jgi:hypothetical protein